MQKLSLLSGLKLILVIQCVSITIAYSQNANVVGRVTDNYTELALGGALVQVLDSEIKGYTDDQGNFVLANVPPGEKTIRISYLGYDPISKSVSVPSDGIARVDASFATSADRARSVSRSRLAGRNGPSFE